MSKILLCPSAFHPSLGGVEEICRNLGQQLQQKGFDVAVAVNRYPSSLPEHEYIQGLPVFRFAFDSPARTAGALSAIASMPAKAAAFLKFVREYDPDVIHVICPSSNSLYCYAAHKLLHTPLVVTLQGEFFMDSGGLYQKSAYARYWASKLLEAATAVTACSAYVMQDAKNRFAFDCAVERVIFNGVDLHETVVESTVNSRHNPFILGLGRLVKNKGFDWLMRAFENFSRTNPHVDLVIAGEGPERQTLQDIAAGFSAQERITLLGRQDRESVGRLFRDCLFFVMPSPEEPFGIVCLEAMRAAKPVIAANAGGPPEFVTAAYENGLLVPPMDVDALSSAMSRLYLDDGLRQKLGNNGARFVQEFSWDRITDSYLGVYCLQRTTINPATATEVWHTACSKQ
ncbi:MAG TPA: glycosyltransferase family 4 protein [Candidatus Obscuribacterales bacterium]